MFGHKIDGLALARYHGRMPSDVQSSTLEHEIAIATMRGWRLQSKSPERGIATMVSGNPAAYRGPNHLLHLILALLTCGLWAPIWLLITLTDRPPQEKSLLIVVDEAGRISYREGR